MGGGRSVCWIGQCSYVCVYPWAHMGWHSVGILGHAVCPCLHWVYGAMQCIRAGSCSVPVFILGTWDGAVYARSCSVSGLPVSLYFSRYMGWSSACWIMQCVPYWIVACPCLSLVHWEGQCVLDHSVCLYLHRVHGAAQCVLDRPMCLCATLDRAVCP